MAAARGAAWGLVWSLMLALEATSTEVVCRGRGVAFLLRCAGAVRTSRLGLVQQYARELEGVADFWVQYDATCAPWLRPRLAEKCARLAAAARADLVALDANTTNLNVHIVTSDQALAAYPALNANWDHGDRIREWGDKLGRQQHETFVLAWWRAVAAERRYYAVWVVEDDVRYGGNVAEFVRAHEAAHGPCASGGVRVSGGGGGDGVQYAGSQFKPTHVATGSAYLRQQWAHWTKRGFTTRAFRARVPESAWVRKVEYVEKYGARLLHALHVAMLNGTYAFGEFFASSVCAAAPAWCTMLDIACCPPTSEHEYLRHCTYTGLPRAKRKEDVVHCVALRVKHWVDRISHEQWIARHFDRSARWYHPVKWR